MGLFQSVISTVSVSSLVTPYLTKAAKLVANSEFGKSIKNSVKNMVDDYIGDYTSKIETERWTDMVLERTNLEGLTDEQLSEYSDLADSFSNVLTEGDKWNNVKTSIAENKKEWGVYLANHGVTSEKIAEIAESKDVSGYDMLKLTWTDSSLSEDKAAEQSTEKTEQSAETTASDSLKDSAKDFVFGFLPDGFSDVANAVSDKASDLGFGE